MYRSQLKFFFIVNFCLVVIASAVGNDNADVAKLKVFMRMIGHEVLLEAGDTTSRVLPIVEKDNRYKIAFDSEFSFVPEQLKANIDSIIIKNKIKGSYLLEVERCDSNLVVYSYFVGDFKDPSMIPCALRDYPEACYNIYMRLMEQELEISPTLVAGNDSKTEKMGLNPLLIKTLFALCLLFGIIFFFLRSRREKTIDPNQIALGKYRFDTKNTWLELGKERLDLSNKESELLLLLYNNVNHTVEREKILEKVWSDDGNYIGRTLDVFISKLRKKLESDDNLKIVNIRGVGYKLIMNVA